VTITLSCSGNNGTATDEKLASEVSPAGMEFKFQGGSTGRDAVLS
jgi:hypothetical protein